MRENPTNTPIIHSVYYLCRVAAWCVGWSVPSGGGGGAGLTPTPPPHATTPNTPIHNILSTDPQLRISQKALERSLRMAM
jgi:hypothetical protein